MSTHINLEKLTKEAVNYGYSLGLSTDEIIQVLWFDHPVSPLDILKKAFDEAAASKESSSASK